MYFIFGESKNDSLTLQKGHFMTRFKAASIHFSICIGVAVFMTAMMLYWYSPQLISVSGGLRLLGIMACVDLVLGPLLTLIVYNESKRSLKFDLGLIATFQIVALCYAGYVAYWARPQFVVAAIDRFELIPALEVRGDAFLTQALARCERFRPWSPCWVGFELKSDPLGLNMGREQYFPQTYLRLKDQSTALWARTKTSSDGFRYIPLVGKSGDIKAVMKEGQALPDRFISEDPWAD
jgi:uncharacterized membrane protein